MPLFPLLVVLCFPHLLLFVFAATATPAAERKEAPAEEKAEEQAEAALMEGVQQELAAQQVPALRMLFCGFRLFSCVTLCLASAFVHE